MLKRINDTLGLAAIPQAEAKSDGAVPWGDRLINAPIERRVWRGTCRIKDNAQHYFLEYAEKREASISELAAALGGGGEVCAALVRAME